MGLFHIGAYMWQNFKELLSDPFISAVIGISIGLIGVILAFIFYIKSKPISKISSFHSYTNLIGTNQSKLPKQVSISYNNKYVKSVSSSEFIIWNSGNTVINKRALATKDPLRIEINPDIKLLRYQIIIENNPTNNISLKTDEDYPNSILIDFDFLEKNEGARIEILHTGTKKDLKERGKIIGVKSIFSKEEEISKKKNVNKNSISYKVHNFFINLFFTALLIGIAAMTFYSFAYPESEMFREKEVITGGNPWYVRILGIISLVWILTQYMQIKPPFPTTLKKPDN